eukprot:CAMPEP_0179208706 /NCGR_PEP_ID=MMETSP0796-20121207/104086_1 /TAXON_ID=73915 /ORGANISM="Pyrodinium bahamense, Strain pbaha01" /LENGTH=259 /DNA_ID=CAMNT_0020913661 /DNA_START=42 /DNA_END=820 /DNA_ORIENTATION=-
MTKGTRWPAARQSASVLMPHRRPTCKPSAVVRSAVTAALADDVPARRWRPMLAPPLDLLDHVLLLDLLRVAEKGDGQRSEQGHQEGHTEGDDDKLLHHHDDPADGPVVVAAAETLARKSMTKKTQKPTYASPRTQKILSWKRHFWSCHFHSGLSSTNFDKLRECITRSEPAHLLPERVRRAVEVGLPVFDASCDREEEALQHQRPEGGGHEEESPEPRGHEPAMHKDHPNGVLHQEEARNRIRQRGAADEVVHPLLNLL